MVKNLTEQPPCKVLVIDDERGPRESLRILLKKEFDVQCAGSVDEGIEIVRNLHPDLVILDIRMPGKDGIEGLKEIREIDDKVSVVMLTGYGALETAQQALRLGACDYMNKPFDTTEMLNIVRKHSRRTQVERERARMLQELKEMNARLLEDLAGREQMASIGESSREFAHDLRNPLMIVSGYVDLLSAKLEQNERFTAGEPDALKEYLDIIGANVRRCCDLAKMWQKLGTTDFARQEPIQVSQVMNDLMIGIEPLASSEDVEVTYKVDTRGGWIQGNRAQLLRGLHNLVANAVQAVKPGTGRVEITCTRKDRITIVIRDNGIGMPPDVLERIFDPYFTTKPEGQGTGLGTVIAKKIIEEHSGEIAIESEPGKGTTITVTLPLLEEHAVA